MYVAFYRWRLKPGDEQAFQHHWEQGTLLFREGHSAWGSRLHKGDDGTYFAYAQWPDRVTYHSKRELSLKHQEALESMRQCILESFPPVLGEVTCDLLVTPE